MLGSSESKMSLSVCSDELRLALFCTYSPICQNEISPGGLLLSAASKALQHYSSKYNASSFFFLNSLYFTSLFIFSFCYWLLIFVFNSVITSMAWNSLLCADVLLRNYSLTRPYITHLVLARVLHTSMRIPVVSNILHYLPEGEFSRWEFWSGGVVLSHLGSSLPDIRFGGTGSFCCINLWLRLNRIRYGWWIEMLRLSLRWIG